MEISKLDLYNFRCFKREIVTFKTKQDAIRHFTVLIGDNATGKTTILEAIAKAFVPVLRLVNKKVADPDYFKDITDSDINIGEKWTAVGLDVRYDEKDYSWHNYRRVNARINMNELGEIKAQREIKDSVIQNIENEDKEKRKTPLVIYYSTNRMFVDIPRRRSTRQTVLEANEALDFAFTTKNEFRRFYNWFKNEEEIELRMLRSKRDYSSKKLDAVRNALNSVIRGYDNLRVEAQPSRMVLNDENGRELSVTQLSGGYKAIFSLVCDIASRLALAYPNSNKPLECKALILIDELDLHLHPKWQKTIVSDLKRTFPNCQFIVTTHSPFIIQSLSSEEVINLDKENNFHGDYIGWSLDEISEHEMLTKMADDKNEAFEDLLNNFQEAIKNNSVEKSKELYYKIKPSLYPNNEVDELMKIQLLSIGVDKV